MTTTTQKVWRLSYSTLEMWQQGESDRAIAGFLGKKHPFTTPMLELGRTKHKLWESEVLRTGCIPKELGGQKLNNPIVERKHVRDLILGDGSILQLVGVLDCEDYPIIRDWKVSMRSPSVFLSSHQKYYYKLLIPEAERFEWRVWNPLTKKYGVVYAHLDDTDIDKGLDWVLTVATDFINSYELMIGEDYNDEF